MPKKKWLIDCTRKSTFIKGLLICIDKDHQNTNENING
jgi:hypothetical protein